MRRTSRGLIAIGSLLACLVGGVGATAQDKPAAAAPDKLADNMEVLREKMRADKRAVVASVLQLTEGEAKAFWPVYNAYQSDAISRYDRLQALVDTFTKNYDTMSDETAMKLLNDYLVIEGDYVALMRKYLPRFKKVLPPKKVARLYQVENKARALVNYDLAREIPLVKSGAEKAP